MDSPGIRPKPSPTTTSVTRTDRRASTASNDSQVPLLQPDAPLRPTSPDANLGRAHGLQVPRPGAGQATATGTAPHTAPTPEAPQARPTEKLQKPPQAAPATPPAPAARVLDRPLLRIAALWRASKPARRILLKAAIVATCVGLSVGLIAVGSMSGAGLVLAIALFMSPVGYLAWSAANKAYNGAVARQAQAQQLAQPEPQAQAPTANPNTNAPIDADGP